MEYSKRTIYFDYAASTPVDPTVERAMRSVSRVYGNPSAFNELGRKARKALDRSRHEVARFLGARSDEVVFTGSGSEANSLALAGVLRALPRRRGAVRAVTTPIEHRSVHAALRAMERERGLHTGRVRVDRFGRVDVEHLRALLVSRPHIVSIMYANNEVGTVQRIREFGLVIQAFRQKIGSAYPFFHTDACQATEWLDMNVRNLGVDLLSLNGAKVYGPRGIGVLYVRRGVELEPLVYGGDQEHGFRAGTENLPAIVGFATALSLVRREGGIRMTRLRDYCIAGIRARLPEARLNGPEGDERLPNNVHISIPGLTSELILMELDALGIFAGSGSACTARSVEPSHVLRAIKTPERYLAGAVRFSFGRSTTKRDIDALLDALPKVVRRLSKRYHGLSPVTREEQ